MKRASWFVVAFAVAISTGIIPASAAVTVTAATGGSAVSADTSVSGSVTLTGPAVSEGDKGEISLGSIVLNAPSGFAFDTGASVVASVTPVSAAATNLTIAGEATCAAPALSASAPVSSATVTIWVCRRSDAGNSATRNAAKITFSGIEVRATSGTLATGDITKTGTATIAGTTTSTNFGTLQSVPGALDSVTISPASASVPVDGSVTFTGTPRDQFGNARTDIVTYAASSGGTINATTGEFTAGTLAATFAGAVTANAGSKSASADVTVEPGALHSLAISPASSSITAGGDETYSVEGFDTYGNSRGDETAAATFSISPDGSCAGATCGATVAGTHTVTADIGGVQAVASLDVTPGALASVTLSAAPGSVYARPASGSSSVLTAVAADAYGNRISGVAIAFAITGDESGAGLGDPASPSLDGAGGTTNSNGEATVTYTAGVLFGDDEVTATAGTTTDSVTIVVQPFVCSVAACTA